ncbi:MAG: nicotinate phosphoribosyltransferase [Candidatus Omnitrophica bacterium]|nr:nicotinate phosphoribosyltransferase [Candidatus Omnitrophota bacterium]
MQRIEPSVFKIPTDKLRAGYYTDRYFLRTRDVLRFVNYHHQVGYQFFPREDAVICGLDEAIAILKTCSGEYRDPRLAQKWYRQLREVQWNLQRAGYRQLKTKIMKWEKQRAQIRERLNLLWRNGWEKLKVYALADGTRVKRHEAVLAIVGNPRYFAHLETPILGVIARPTATATAVSEVVEAAQGKQVLFFSARFDHYWVQTADGYAALKAGAFGVSTEANADYWGVESMGTIPHFLIGCFGGDTVQSFLNFDKYMPADMNRIALVDWDNDCIGTTAKIIARMIEEKINKTPITEEIFLRYAPQMIGSGKGKLWGVRFDTAGGLRDRSVTSHGKSSYGVCPELVKKARREFDRWGCRNLTIVVSGGFDAVKIRRFERTKVPVDAYGVGSSLLRRKIDITADIVEYEGRNCAKVGRQKVDWSRLSRVR